jgi:hypothetical protein
MHLHFFFLFVSFSFVCFFFFFDCAELQTNRSNNGLTRNKAAKQQ